MPIFETTLCCALYHLRIQNTETIAEITKTLVESKKREADSPYARTTCYTIVTPEESLLPDKLLKLGFRKVTEFRGKRTYGTRMLSMFVIDFADVKCSELKKDGTPDKRFKVNN